MIGDSRARLLRVESDRDLAHPLLGVDPDVHRKLLQPSLSGRLVEATEALPFVCGNELLDLGGIDRRPVVARLDTTNLLASDRLDRTGDGLQELEHGARIGSGERAHLAELSCARPRELLGVALDPRLAGRQLLRKQREVDVRRAAVLNRVELPVVWAPEIALHLPAEAGADALHELREGREIDAQLRPLGGCVETTVGAERQLLVDAGNRRVDRDRELGRVDGGARLCDLGEARQLGNGDAGTAATGSGGGEHGDEGHERDVGAPNGHLNSMHRQQGSRP